MLENVVVRSRKEEAGRLFIVWMVWKEYEGKNMSMYFRKGGNRWGMVEKIVNLVII